MVRKFVMWSGMAMIVAVLAAGVVVAQQASGRGKPAPSAAAEVSAPVNLNTATPIELQALPNIGPAAAARIVEYRQKNGGFKKIEDLMNVKGIGEKSFLKLRPLVTVAPPKPTER